MAFGATSDPFILFAWAIGIIALAVSVALALQVLYMRGCALQRERRREATFAAWRPVLFQYLMGSQPAIPALHRRDEDSFLLLWNQMQDGIRGEAHTRLNQLADVVDAHGMARRRLDRGDALGRLLALGTLGYLRLPADRADVVPYLDDHRTYLCLAAARALVRIDPAGAPDEILPRLAERPDWPVSLLAKVLGEADRARLSSRSRELYFRLSSEQLIRLLPLASMIDDDVRDEILRRLFTARGEPDVLGAALKVVRSPALLPQVRRACEHEAWTVRTQGAAALGRIGGMPERDILLRLLRDPQWWVRYRAAQAMTSGRFGPAAEVTALAAGLHDRFARDIVRQALAEGRR